LPQCGGGAPLRLLPRQPRFASLVPRISIMCAQSKFALLGRKSGKFRLFLPRSANSGFALLGRFLENRLRFLAKTRQICSVLPSRFWPIWKSICASWQISGVSYRNRCASWKILGVFCDFSSPDRETHRMVLIDDKLAKNSSPSGALRVVTGGLLSGISGRLVRRRFFGLTLNGDRQLVTLPASASIGRKPARVPCRRLTPEFKQGMDAGEVKRAFRRRRPASADCQQCRLLPVPIANGGQRSCLSG
jgi:hypothetical protein